MGWLCLYIGILIFAKITKNQIAITFDDGPHPEFTPKILMLLKAYNAKATFFCIGKHIELYPIDKVKPIILYMNNTDDMKLIKEFYEDYRLKEEYKKGFTICIKKLITINFKKK